MPGPAQREPSGVGQRLLDEEVAAVFGSPLREWHVQTRGGSNQGDMRASIQGGVEVGKHLNAELCSNLAGPVSPDVERDHFAYARREQVTEVSLADRAAAKNQETPFEHGRPVVHGKLY